MATKEDLYNYNINLLENKKKKEYEMLQELEKEKLLKEERKKKEIKLKRFYELNPDIRYIPKNV